MSEEKDAPTQDVEKARVTTGSTQYDYVDQTKTTPEAEVTPFTARSSEATTAELNPAFYPRDTKPEALHNEAEKAGAEFPGGGQLQAALHAQDDELDPTDPEVANPAAPAADGSTSKVQAAADKDAEAAKTDDDSKTKETGVSTRAVKAAEAKAKAKS